MNESPGNTAVLGTATDDAERWLALWFHQGIEGGGPPEVRDFNAAVTALRRLIDARKALRELERHDHAELGTANNRTADEEITDALGQSESESQAPGDPDAMPEGPGLFCAAFLPGALSLALERLARLAF